MNYRCCVFFIFLALLELGCLRSHAADPPLVDLESQVRKLIDRHNYKELEKLVLEWQGKDGALPLCRDGQSRLMAVHMSLQHYRFDTPRAWQTFQTLLDAWQKAEPESGHWRIYQASHLCGQIGMDRHAAEAQAHWATAARLLDEAEAKLGRVPDWYCSYEQLAYTARRMVARGFSTAVPEKFAAWLPVADEGIRHFPDHVEIELEGSNLAKTEDFPGHLDGWARHASELVPGLGGEPYVRIWWGQEFVLPTSLFHPDHADWPTFRTGFEALLKHHPDSKRLVAKFLEFCRKAGDRDTALKLLPLVGDQPGADAFPVVARFLEIREWANGRPVVFTPVWAHRHLGRGVVAWSKDGLRLYSGNHSSSVHVVNAMTGELVTLLRLEDSKKPRDINDIEVSPDGRLVAAVDGRDTGTKAGTCRVWRTDNLVVQDEFASHAGPLRSISWAHDSSKLIATGGLFEGPGEVWQWIDGGGAELLTWATAQKYNIQACAWAPDNSKILLNGSSGRITVMEPDQKLRTVKQTVVPGMTWVTALGFSPDSRWVAASCANSYLDQFQPNGAVAIFQGSDMAPRSDAQAPLTEGLLTVDWSPDGQRVAAGGFDGYVYLLDAASLEIRQWWNPEQGAIAKIRWSPDGTRLAVATEAGWVGVWAAPGG